MPQLVLVLSTFSGNVTVLVVGRPVAILSMDVGKRDERDGWMRESTRLSPICASDVRISDVPLGTLTFHESFEFPAAKNSPSYETEKVSFLHN